MPDGGYPTTAASGITLTDLSHQRCLDVLVERMGYAELRAAQVRLRDKALTAASASASSRARRPSMPSAAVAR